MKIPLLALFSGSDSINHEGKKVNNGANRYSGGQVFFHSEWIMATGHYTWKVFFHSLG